MPAAPEPEDRLSEKLRSSLSEFRDSWNEAIDAINAEEEKSARTRKRSVVEEAAAKITQRQEMKRRISVTAEEAAEKGKDHLETSHRESNQRRMSAIASDAAGSVAHKIDDHDDAVKHQVCGSVHPEWQIDHRARGTSIAQDAATFVEEKGKQKRRGSAAGDEAAKMAIFRGSAVH